MSDRSSPDGFYTDKTGRTRPFFAVDVYVKDNGEDYLQRLAGQFPAEFNRALRGAGAEMRQRILTAIEQGGARTNRWEPLSGLFKIGKRRGRFTFRRSHAPRAFYGRMRKAISYYHDRRQFMVRIGWSSSSSEKIYKESLAPGGKVPVTSKMQRFYFLTGKGLSKGKREIDIPPRPIIGPMWRQESGSIVELIEKRVLRYVKKTRNNTAPRLADMHRWVK